MGWIIAKTGKETRAVDPLLYSSSKVLHPATVTGTGAGMPACGFRSCVIDCYRFDLGQIPAAY